MNTTPLFLLTLFLSGCLKDSAPKISYEQYKEQGALMINITEKLAREHDADRLNEAAKGVELSRVVACRRLLNECELYGHFLSQAIELSSDHSLSFDDVTTIQTLQKNLKSEIERGYAQFEKK